MKKRRDIVANNPDTAATVQAQGILSSFSGQNDPINTISLWLLKSAWVLLEAPKEQPFITSDNPGFSIDRSEQPHNLNFSENSDFYFPITPRYALAIEMIDPNFDKQALNKQIWHKIAEPDLIRKLSHSTCLISHKYILSNDEEALRQAWQDYYSSK